LHVGTAIYGNIGAANRLDFTVIGPAVNLVSRVEAVAETPRPADRGQQCPLMGGNRTTYARCEYFAF
jgi:class 3 adenylate cyclase